MKARPNATDPPTKGRDPLDGATWEPLPPLPLPIRLLLYVIGGVLLLVGVLGLALPGLQGLLTLLLGAAVLSLGSATVDRFLDRQLSRWPKVWKRAEHMRSRMHRFFSPSPKG